MRSELRKEMLRILEELSNPEAKPYVYEATTPRLTVDAVELLRGAKAISEKGSDPGKITIQGYDYYRQLKAPRRYWLEQNWFPVAVLTVSSVVTVVTSLIVVLLG